MDKERKANLDRALNPKVIAVVGDKKITDYMWLKSVKDAKAKVYSVQIDENDIPGIEEMGIDNRKSISDIPEQVDYAIIAVPRPVLPFILADCIKNNVGAAAAFTSGFAETGEPEGIELQEKIIQMTSEANFNLVGPNCMCMYHAKVGIRNTADQWIGEGGNIGFMSNSGTHATNFVIRARSNGLYPAKSISMGNSISIDQGDWLEYLGDDPDIEVIGMYIEGTRDGRKFFETLREVAQKKPVVIWKGGQTKEGARAAASHTGHLASDMALWDAMIRQTGAIRVDTQDELMDTMKALLMMKPFTGENMGIIAQTGGQSVLVSDAFGSEELKVPALTETTHERLRPIVTVVGGSYKNPLDVSGSLTSVERATEMLNGLHDDPNTDIIVMESSIGFIQRRLEKQGQGLDTLIEGLKSFQESSKKPFGVIATWNQNEGELADFRKKVSDAGIAVFPTFQAGAGAIRKVRDYYRKQETLGTK
ncbi:MAG: CoA-binding protein [Chloroflexota bacterium]|mgnify:FL=1|jgi:acyl-CoA synthetase (NDP forming)|nr:CoA-binding protein [Chloroflexota bacterium]|tara:strand:+ start:6099 stop:7532 length:1434 start_codon:yes stop_codon:yes gene_type:complete